LINSRSSGAPFASGVPMMRRRSRSMQTIAASGLACAICSRTHTIDDTNEFLRRATMEQPMTNFSIDVGQSAVGGIGIRIGQDVHRHVVELGFWLGQEFLETRHNDGSDPSIRRLMLRKISAPSDLCRALCEQSRFCARSGKERLHIGGATEEQCVQGRKALGFASLR